MSGPGAVMSLPGHCLSPHDAMVSRFAQPRLRRSDYITSEDADVARADLQRVERAAVRLVEAREEMRVALELARASGERLEDIGRAAGISRQAVAKALRRRED